MPTAHPDTVPAIKALLDAARRAAMDKDWAASRRLLEEAIQIAPQRAQLHQELARAHRAEGHLESALAIIDHAINLNPQLRSAHLYRGAVLEELGRDEEALQAYWRAWGRFLDPQLLASDALAPTELRPLALRAATRLREVQCTLIATALTPVLQAEGATALTRVQKAADIYTGLSTAEQVHPLQQPAFLQFPGLAPRAFYAREELPWLAALEAATAVIRRELAAVLASRAGLKPYVQVEAGTDPQQWRELDGSLQWSSFHLFKAGTKVHENCARCPVTTRLLESLPLPRMPGHAPEALFSILQPGTHIPPHHGLANYKLVAHLPLVVPPDCALRVGSETRGWREGECLIFDDSFEHEAWNRSPALRAVLILDVWHPALTGIERAGVTALVDAIGQFNRRYALAGP